MIFDFGLKNMFLITMDLGLGSKNDVPPIFIQQVPTWAWREMQWRQSCHKQYLVWYHGMAWAGEYEKWAGEHVYEKSLIWNQSEHTF